MVIPALCRTDRIPTTASRTQIQDSPGLGLARGPETRRETTNVYTRAQPSPSRSPARSSRRHHTIFVSKNEWKRHVLSQHLQLGFYRCDVGKCNHHPRSRSQNSSPPPGQPNDFNRKDLFTQHQRRIHAPWQQPGRRRAPSEDEQAAFEAGLEQVRQRCWHELRQPPLHSQCVFCQEVFSGEGSWDARMEHVGRHVERDDPQTLSHANEDVLLREWGLREGILQLVDGQFRLASLGGIGR
ncbi:hypothetical protein N7468_006078 [Penicillium chermesinum]|uniref:C2H2-type domain-containing protein n=1 Tax=Penicillium chermesinum TaxID=63820 RepID=A0A9W9TNU7_9EURO|nr:uncharacterized protein N7468_006078 [Penicillium chermesinum]KAJ5233122.1 hypothetical protein N7468_006078 [Penicillium chermesinum]